MVYILIILLLLALLAYTYFSKNQPPAAPVQQATPPTQHPAKSTEQPKVVHETISKPEQRPEILEERPTTQKPVEQTVQSVHAAPEEKKIHFHEIQNPLVEKAVPAATFEAKREEPLQKEIAKVVPAREEKAAQEEDDTISNLSIFNRRQRQEASKPVGLEEKGEATLKELEREFVSKEDRRVGEFSLPSIQDLQKAPGERIEAISPVLRSAVVDEEDEESKPSFENLEEVREIEEIVAATEKADNAPVVQQEVPFVPQDFGAEKVEEKILEEAVPQAVDTTKQEVAPEQKHPEFREQAHFVPEDFQASRKQETVLPEESIKSVPEVVKQKSPYRTKKFLPDSLLEEQAAAEKIEEEETPSKFRPEVVESHEAEQAVGEQENKQAAKNTIKRNFNFRTNKSKIESILKKDINHLSLGRDSSTQSDFTMDAGDSILSAPESTVDRINQVGLDDRENIMKEENLLRAVEEQDHHSTKPRGFNFKNPKKKTAVEKKAENAAPQEAAVQSENIDPAGGEDKLQGSMDIGKAETKKMKGFNFRNPGRVKNE